MRAWSDEDGRGISVSSSGTLQQKINNFRKPQISTVNENYLVAVGSRSARFRRRRLQLIIIVTLVILIFILLITIIVISVFYYSEREKRVCQSRQCVRSAANLLMSMDPDADPCEDFYKYACGNWAEEHLKPDTMTSYSLFADKQEKIDRLIRDMLATNYTDDDPKPLTQAKDMYKACMDTESIDSLGMKPVIDFMTSVGLGPIPAMLNLTMRTNYINYNLDWIETVVKIKRKSELDILIGFDILFDFSNTSLKILTFGQPSGSVLYPGYKNVKEIFKTIKMNEVTDDENDDTVKEESDGTIMSLYKLLIQTAVKETLDSVPEKFKIKLSDEQIECNIETALKDYITLYKKIYKIIEENEYKSSADDIIYLKFDKLQNNTDSILKKLNLTTIEVWKKYTTLLFNNTNTTIDFNNDLVMTSESELKILQSILAIVQNSTLERIENYIWFQLLENFIPHTSTTLRDIYDKFIMKAIGVEVSSPRSSYCSNTVNEMMGMAVSYGVLINIYKNTTVIEQEYIVYKMGASACIIIHQNILTRSINNRNEFSEISISFRIKYNLKSSRFNQTKLRGESESFHSRFLPMDELFSDIILKLIMAYKMLFNIKLALENMIVSLVWMDMATKIATVEKVHKMKSLVGFPDWLLDTEKLEKIYSGAEIDLEKHLENQLKLLEFGFNGRLNNFREPQVLGWSTVPTETNAFHTYPANTITIPYVMLQYPFFDLGLDALNYAVLGAILGHELTHGIDNIGRNHDKEGNKKRWWSNDSIEHYLENSQCLVKQFSDFYIPEADANVDGNLTLDENIADNGGLKAALYAYKMTKRKGVDKLPGLTHLKGDQLFFLAHGNLWCGIESPESMKFSLKDSHSPNHLRINGNLQNTPEFAKAWKCPLNSKMNPSRQRCVMF